MSTMQVPDDDELEEYDYDEPQPCNMCSGDAYVLGVLGRLTWFRCRSCGSQFEVSEDV